MRWRVRTLNALEIDRKLTLEDFLQLALFEIQVILPADDANPQVTQRELASFLDVIGVVESNRFAAIDEPDATRTDDLADVTTS